MTEMLEVFPLSPVREWAISRSFIASLQPEIGAPQRFVIGHFRDRAGKADASAFQHKYARRHFEETDILLGDQERQPPPAQIAEDADDFLDEQWRQPGRGLIHHQKPRLGGKRFRDAEHLALAAGETGSRRAALFAQRWKYAIEFLGAGAGIGMAKRLRADANVFLDR